VKALITTLFFLSLLASLVASWTEGLIESTLAPQTLIRGLEERRRDWGRLQLKLFRSQHPSLPYDHQPQRVPLGALFDVGASQGDASLQWMGELLGRLCQFAHPTLQQDPRQSQLLVHSLLQGLEQSRLSGKPQQGDGWSEFKGHLHCNEDLLALPLKGPERVIWQQLLVGAPPAHAALFDWIDIAAFQPVPIEDLPEPVLESILGSKGAQQIMALRPDLRESSLPKYLEPNAVTALSRLVTFNGYLDTEMEAGSSRTHRGASRLAAE